MARSEFGGGLADWVFEPIQFGTRTLVAFPQARGGDPIRVTLWSAAVGGTQYTDLLVAGVPATSILLEADGSLPTFQGPDGVTAPWADAGNGNRRRLSPVNLLISAGGSSVGVDTDGVPYFDPAGVTNPATVSADTDGVPYFAGA